MHKLLLFAFGAVLLAESVAGLHWSAPAGWKTGPEKPMRAATYLVAPVAGDSEAAECVVYFFGQGQGGTVEANLERWKGQFAPVNGKPVEASLHTRTIHGLTVYTIDVAGAYAGMAGMGAQSGPKPNYRMLGAIVENPAGNVFLKFAGPAKTIAANQSKFEQLLSSFDKAR